MQTNDDRLDTDVRSGSRRRRRGHPGVEFLDHAVPAKADISVSRAHRQAGHIGLRVEAWTVDAELRLPDTKSDTTSATIYDLDADNRTIEVDRTFPVRHLDDHVV